MVRALAAKLRYRVQAPLVDTLLREIGVMGGDPRDISELLGTWHPDERLPSAEEA